MNEQSIFLTNMWGKKKSYILFQIQKTKCLQVDMILISHKYQNHKYAFRNMSFEYSKFPEKIKVVEVVPNFKGGEKKLLTN